MTPTPSPLDLVRAAEGFELRYEPEGPSERLGLLPPMDEAEIEALARRIPCPLPQSIRALLGYTRGFANGPLESLELAGLGTFEFAGIFPHPIDLLHLGAVRARTEHRRAGEQPVFAYQRRSQWRRVKDWMGLGG